MPHSKQTLEGTSTMYIAVGWKDRKLKTFIATSGITTPAQTQALKRRFRKAQPEDNTDSPCVRYFIEVPHPSIVEHYFNTANAIDIHNHLRQGGLELERRWRTLTWWHRAFATFIAICETDAYLAFLHFHPNKAVTVNLTHEKFTSELCMQLLQIDSERINGPSMHLRPRPNESAPALTLRTKMGKTVCKHILQGNTREHPLYTSKQAAKPRNSAAEVEIDVSSCRFSTALVFRLSH